MKIITILILFISIVFFGCKKEDKPLTNPTAKTLDLRGNITKCEIHKTDLKEETKEALPRLTVSYTAEYEDAMRTQFPYLGNSFGIDDLTVKYVIVRFCPKCREAKDKWTNDNKNTN